MAVLLRQPCLPPLYPAPRTIPHCKECSTSSGSGTFDSIDNIRNTSNAYSLETVLTGVPDMIHTAHAANGPAGLVTLSVFERKISSKTARPAVYIIHGGGQIEGNRFAALDSLIRYFEGIDIVVISVEYRLAPEHPGPAALEDCYAGLVWTVDHASDLGIIPEKVLIMGGSGGAPRPWRMRPFCGSAACPPNCMSGRAGFIASTLTFRGQRGRELQLQ